MQFTDRETTELIMYRLESTLSDVKGLIFNTTKIGSLYEQEIWVVEVKIDNSDQILVFSPSVLDNGAGGINIDELIKIRQTAGENIPSRPQPSGKRTFDDLNTFGRLFESEEGPIPPPASEQEVIVRSPSRRSRKTDNANNN